MYPPAYSGTRDSILNRHLTDDMRDFGIDYPTTDNPLEQRAISWKYQYDIVQATPAPANWIEVRFEDFVLDQERTLQRLEEYLGIELARIPVRRDAVGRWRTAEHAMNFDFFQSALTQYNYT